MYYVPIGSTLEGLRLVSPSGCGCSGGTLIFIQEKTGVIQVMLQQLFLLMFSVLIDTKSAGDYDCES